MGSDGIKTHKPVLATIRCLCSCKDNFPGHDLHDYGKMSGMGIDKLSEQRQKAVYLVNLVNPVKHAVA